MAFCPNISSKEWKDLVNAQGENVAYFLWDKYKGNIPSMFYASSVEKVNYTPKIVTALAKIFENRKTIRIGTEDQKTNVRKALAGQGVPAEQIALLFNYIDSKGETEAKTDDLILDLLSLYSYAVEINAARDNNFKPIDYDGQYYLVEDNDGSFSTFKTKEEAIKYVGGTTSYYGNLTVPGGTNYTEQEIATPEITPSIKGHAQFATDKGIGWFRSDDKSISIKDSISEMSDDELQQLAKETQMDITELQAKRNYRPDAITDSKIRRILEVQSDLFQKGRDKKVLTKGFYKAKNGLTYEASSAWIQKPGEEAKEVRVIKSEKYTYGETFTPINSLPQDVLDYFKNKSDTANLQSDNQFLQLLNKNNNWVTFFVKSIIQDSAKKGYEKVLFPSGNTASKVEGHETIEEFKKQKEDRIKKLEKQIEEDKNPVKSSEIRITGRISWGASPQEEINQLKQELERVEIEGFGALRPIYNFYQNTVSAVLKKQGFSPKVITDEYGNKWFEVDMTAPEIAAKSSANIAFRAKADASAGSINTERAKAWVEERFGAGSVSVFETAQAIGDSTIHGYVENAMVHLWSAAEVGTEYHEAYHLTFRTMLSEDQRTGLYAEAEKNFGAPTASEIAEIKSQFAGISDEDAYKLVLEEKMAEEFRDYVLTEQATEKSLPSKIAKFFRDLWNFIKAMFSDSLSLRQVYSLIESNNMSRTLASRGVFRNAEKFKGEDKAYLARPGMGEEAITDAIDMLYTNFLEQRKSFKKDFKTSLALGFGDNKGTIANAILLKIYSKPDGTPLTAKEDFNAVLETLAAEEKYTADKSQENLQNLRDVLAKNNLVFALGGDLRKRTIFKNIYTTWEDVVGSKSGNVLQKGWRSALEAKLKDAGMYVDSRFKYDSNVEDSSEVDAELEELNDEFAVIDEAVGKIYGQSSMEISPAKRLTGKVKELLATIKSDKPNSLGVITYLSRDEVFKDLLAIFSGKQTYQGMVSALEQEVKVSPRLQKILDFLKTLSESEKAMIFSAFALSNTEFVMFKQKVDDKLNYVEVFNPNRKDIPTAIAEKWRNNMVQDSPGKLYLRVVTENEDGSIVETLNTDAGRVSAAAKAWKEVEKLLPKLGKVDVSSVDGQVNPIVEKLAETMFELGMFLGNNTDVGDTQMMLQRIANSGIDGMTGTEVMRKVKAELLSILRQVGQFTRSKTSELAEFQGVKNERNLDFVTARKSTIIEFAKIFKSALPISGISFVNGKGKAIYATNTETHMAQIISILKEGSPRSAELLKEYLKDSFISVEGSPEYSSVLFKHLDDPKFLEEFGAFDFDASKLGKESEEALGYEDFSEADTLVTLINAFINNRTDSDYMYIAVPVQSDRDKFTFIKVPRISKNAFKKQFMSHKDLIKAQIVQDLIRVAKAKSVVLAAESGKIPYSELEEGYHTAPGNPTRLVEDRKYLGNAFKESFFQFSAKKDGKYIVTDEVINENVPARRHGFDQMSDFVESFVNKTMDERSRAQFEERLNRMTNDMLEYFSDQATALKAELQAADKIKSIGMSGAIGVDLDGLLKGYVIENAIMRNEIVKLFRGNRALHKTQEDFYKRMGHLTTPGTKMAMLGDISDNYGMFKNFAEIVMRDIKLDLTEAQIAETHLSADNIAVGLMNNELASTGIKVKFEYNKTADSIVSVSGDTVKVNIVNKQGRVSSSKVVEELLQVNPQVAKAFQNAAEIADAYRPGNYDSTDAQAFISLDMHRAIQQGLGKWEKEDEEAYKAYKKTGKFVYQEGFVPDGKKVGDAVVVLAHKGYYENMSYNEVGKTLSTDSQKNSYSVLLAEYTANFPHLDDLRQRMEATGVYEGLKPVHVINFVSGKKLSKRNVYKHTGQLGRLGEANVNTHDSAGLRFPQFIPSPKENPTNALNRQIKKNMVANVEDETNYTISPGVLNTAIAGKDLKEIYHAAIEEKLQKDLDGVLDEMGVTQLREAFDSQDLDRINAAKLAVLKTVRSKVLSEAVTKELHSNYERALDIVFEDDGTPKFVAPLDTPLYNKKYESIIMSVIDNQVFKQKVKGFEAVQVAQIGGSEADGSGMLNFLQISEDGKQVIHAEVMIRPDVARKFGVKPGQPLDSIPEELRRIIGYRIPNQDKASVIVLKIAKFLPEGYAKAVVVPGQLVKLMGSDFDVDKLNLLFPEVDVNKDTGEITKTKVDYKALIANRDLASLSKKQLNNVILDLMEAVYTNPAHFTEVFTPLDDTTLNTVVDEIKSKSPELAKELDWSHYKTEAITARRSTLGNKLRGIYANAVAARNVLQHGKVRMHADYAIKINGNEYRDYIKTAYDNPFDTTSRAYTTDKSMSLFLSAAVDAAKLPVQYELNDTVLTSRIRVLFAGFFPEYSSRYCSLFLNQPIIKEFTDYFETRKAGNLRDLKEAYKTFKATKTDPNKFLDLNKPGTFEMSTIELENLSKEGRNEEEQLKMLANFMKFYEAGSALMKLGKRVTPDSMDGLGRIGSVQSYLDRDRMFDVNEDSLKTPIFTEPGSVDNVVDQFIGEKSIYGLERGYDNLLQESLKYAETFFPVRLSESFKTFKEQIMGNIEIQNLTPEMHQLIDYNLMFMMLMRPSSPFAQLMDMKHMYNNANDNIYTKLQALKTKYRGLNTNPFVANLEADADPEKKYYGIKFDNTFKAGASEKQAYTDGLYNLLYNPQFYITTDKTMDADGKYVNPETAAAYKEINSFGIKLAMHSFYVNGFRQGASSYSDIVPLEFFTTPMDVKETGEKISILQFFEREANKAKQGDYFSNEDMVRFMAAFGKMRAGGSNLLNRVNLKKFGTWTTEFTQGISDNFVVARNDLGHSAVFGNAGLVQTEDGSWKSRFVRLEGTFSTKGSTKLFGLNFVNTQNKPINVSVLETVAETNTMLRDKGILPNESGNMSCTI